MMIIHYIVVTVFGDRQESTDLVYVTNSKDNDVSVDWLAVVNTDKLIIRKAELSFVKVYDLVYKNLIGILK